MVLNRESPCLLNYSNNFICTPYSKPENPLRESACKNTFSPESRRERLRNWQRLSVTVNKSIVSGRKVSSGYTTRYTKHTHLHAPLKY